MRPVWSDLRSQPWPGLAQNLSYNRPFLLRQRRKKSWPQSTRCSSRGTAHAAQLPLGYGTRLCRQCVQLMLGLPPAIDQILYQRLCNLVLNWNIRLGVILSQPTMPTHREPTSSSAPVRQLQLTRPRIQQDGSLHRWLIQHASGQSKTSASAKQWHG